MSCSGFMSVCVTHLSVEISETFPKIFSSQCSLCSKQPQLSSFTSGPRAALRIQNQDHRARISKCGCMVFHCNGGDGEGHLGGKKQGLRCGIVKQATKIQPRNEAPLISMIPAPILPHTPSHLYLQGVSQMGKSLQMVVMQI